MNPFDVPPSTPAVSYEPPRPPKRRRGLVIGAAVVGAGLVGAGAVGVGALVSADDPEPDATDVSTSQDDAIALSTTELGDGDRRALHECLGLSEAWTDAPSSAEDVDPPELPPLEELFGEDFSLEELFGEDFSLEELFGEDFSLEELFGEFEGEFPMFEDFESFEGELPALEELFGEFEGEFPMFEEFGSFEGELPALEELFGEFEGEFPMFEDVEAMLDGLVAVMGPDGPIVIDLGDADGAVTIERDGDSGEVTVTTDGDAAIVDLDALVEDMIVPLIPDDLRTCLDGPGGPRG